MMTAVQLAVERTALKAEVSPNASSIASPSRGRYANSKTLLVARHRKADGRVPRDGSHGAVEIPRLASHQAEGTALADISRRCRTCARTERLLGEKP
jgi:hypothetical protein